MGPGRRSCLKKEKKKMARLSRTLLGGGTRGEGSERKRRRRGRRMVELLWLHGERTKLTVQLKEK